MDFQRIILIGALVFFGYMLALQWQQDYHDPAAPTPVTSVSTQSQSQVAVNDTASEAVNEPLAAPQAPAAAADDVPTAESPEAVAESTSLTTLKAGELVSVKTDVLSLLIEPYGGDIIHAELENYLAQLGSEQKFVLLEQNDQRVYVAQSGLTGRNGPDATGRRPQYQTAAQSYTLAEGEDQLQVDLIYQQDNGVKITKRFTFERGRYKARVEYLINNGSNEAWQANLFGQIKRDRSPDPTEQTSMGMQSYLGPAFSTQETPYKKVEFDDIDEGRYSSKTLGGWAAMLQHYFVSAWVPNPDQSHNYFARERNGNYLAGFVSPALNLAPGEQGSLGADVYVGPKIQERLEATAPNLQLTVDYGWLWWIAQPLFSILDWVENMVKNWGVAIIILTAMIKVVFFWPSAIAYRSMAKMRTMAPEMQRLKELYGDDRQKLSQAMMELYKKEKINPLGGCLPLLIQMPVFLSLYWVLMESVELRHAPFMLWINDLSVMDPYFILPILMGVSMFIQQMLNPTPPDPMQAKIMKLLPFIFTVFFLWFPAGLVLYWLVNNILSIMQQWYITRQIEAEANAKKAKA